MVSITDPFKAIATWFSTSSKGKEIITILEQISKGNFSYKVKIPSGKEDDEHIQILKGLELTLRELEKLDKREKRRHKQMTKANKQLKQLDKNKREFIELASHQLKTPLASLRLGLDVLERSSRNWSDRDKQVFSEVKHSYDHMAKLVESLLETVRIDERANMQPKCQLNSAHNIFTIMEKQFRSRFEAKGLELIVEYPIESLRIRTDAGFVVEILQNLLENALKYTKIGIVRLEITEMKNVVEFRVADTGIGIPALEQSRAFEKLFRASNVKDESDVGSGLGLYYTQQLVKRLKGKIWFESEEGNGSVFYVRIPKDCVT